MEFLRKRVRQTAEGLRLESNYSDRRVPLVVLGITLAVPAVRWFYAGLFGRSGPVAIVVGSMFLIGLVLLVWTGWSGRQLGQFERKLVRVVFYSGVVTMVGFGGLGLGILLFPNSNLLGGFGLLFGPIYWLGSMVLAVVTGTWSVTIVWRALARSMRGRNGAV